MSFEAKYHGRCGDCGEHIEPGDRVRFDDEVIVHEECDDIPTLDRPLREVCTECWLEKPCGCGEF